MRESTRPVLWPTLGLLLTATLAAQESPPSPGGQAPYVPRPDPPRPPLAASVPPPANDPAPLPPSAVPASQGPAPYPMPRTASDGPRVAIELTFGGGRFEHTTKGTPSRSDETSAGHFRAGFELMGDSNFGGGLRIEAVASDDDLFVDTSGLPSKANDLEVFLHGTGMLGNEALRVPMRFGLFLRNYRVEDKTTAATIDWTSFGPRIEVEPDLRLAGEGDFRWSLVGKLGVGVGVTRIETDPSTATFDSSMFAVDLGLGTRFTFKHVQLDIGYLLRGQSIAESDVEGLAFVREVDTEYSGLLLGLTVHF